MIASPPLCPPAGHSMMTRSESGRTRLGYSFPIWNRETRLIWGPGVPSLGVGLKTKT